MVPKVLSEMERLAGNQQALLKAMPEKVFLISGNGVIEYMNPSAIASFGNLQSGKPNSLPDERVVQARLVSILNILLSDVVATESTQGDIGGVLFDCSIAPFFGYKGDDLYWLILRDIGSSKNAENYPRKQKASSSSDMPMIGRSKVMQDLHKLIGRVSRSDATVLISGESGTGKELVANLIRRSSRRNNKPFLTINCNTINDLLLESDLFGYEKGSFTGAHSRKKGVFEAVSGGTIFLDEIGDSSPRLQAALLRVLQNGEIIRVGGNTPIKVNARIIVATNKDLVAAVQKGDFRLDLFFRLNIININVRPLRERKGDIADLLSYFVEKYSNLYDKKINFVPELIIDKLFSYDWPGNIRELENAIQRAMLVCEGDKITNDDIVFAMPIKEEELEPTIPAISKFNGSPLKSIVAQLEREIIVQKLELHQGNVALAAEGLQLCKTALYVKMKRHEISAKKLRKNTSL